MRLTLGIRTHMGWVAVAAVGRGRGGLRVIATAHIETGRDRDSIEPYHVAAALEML